MESTPPAEKPPAPVPIAAPSPPPGLPGHVRIALEDLPAERRPWQNGLAPHCIGMFLWIVFLDPLAARTLPVGGLAVALLGAVAAGLLCYVGLFFAPAMLGLRTGRPLMAVATSTFGLQGSAWVPGGLMVAGQIVWFAVGTWFGTDLAFRGLIRLGMLDPSALEPVAVGPLWFPSAGFLATSLVWMVLIALLGATFLRLVLALNLVFPVVPAVLLGGCMLWLVRHAPGFEPTGIDPVLGRSARPPGLATMAAMIQLVCGFFATAGAMSVDWGAASTSERDVRYGGLVGVVLAPAILASVALLLVAGSIGKALAPPEEAPPGMAALPDPLGLDYVRPGASRPVPGLALDPGPARPEDPARLSPFRFTVRAAIREGVGGWPAGAIFLVLGLFATGPAAYACYTFAQLLMAMGPGLTRVQWKLVGVGLGWLLIVAGFANKLEYIFGVVGGAFAALIGAMAADSARHRRSWPGPRRGYNVAGLAAWAIGMGSAWAGVGLGAALGWTPWPWTVFALAVSFAAYLLLAAILGEPEAMPEGTLPPREGP